MDRLRKILDIEALVRGHPNTAMYHGLHFIDNKCYIQLLFNDEYFDVWIRTLNDEQLGIILDNLSKWCI